LAPNCMAMPEATITWVPGTKKAGRSQLGYGQTTKGIVKISP
jgi:hypothetical protein